MAMEMLHRKERFIITAIDIIDEIGIQGLSTREIAKREGVSEATLFRHFKNKNALYVAILDYYSKFDHDIFQTTELKKLEPREAILFFVNSYMEYYQNYPAIVSIMEVMGVLKYEPGLDEQIKGILKNRTGYLRQLIERAQKSGRLNSDIDSQSFAEILFGYSRDICFRWRLENQSFSLRDRVSATVGKILIAFSGN